MALTGCRRNHPERLKRNQNPSCFSLEGFGKPWIQSKRVGGGASEQPCWFQEVGRRRRWGRAVGLEVQVCLLPPAGRSQDKGHSRGREKRNEADLWGPADKLLPPQPSHQEQQPLQSLIDWPRPSVSVTRDERSTSSSAFALSINTWSAHWSPLIATWSICSHWQAAVEQPIKMHRTSCHHRRQPIRSRHENPKKSKCCTRVWTCDLCTSSWRRRGGALGPRRRLCQDHRRYRKIKKLEYFLRLKS